MKVIEIGNCGNYEDVKFNLSKKPNKYESLYYFKERIYLVKNTPITDYAIWSNGNELPFLAIQNDADLCSELKLLCDALCKQDNTLTFIKFKPDDRLYFKFGKDCGSSPANCELTYCICIYGCFRKPNGGMASLQMEVSEQSTKVISLLGKRKCESTSDEPLSKQLFSANNYTPNSMFFEFGDN